MDAQACAGRLARSGEAIVRLIEGISDDLARWKSDPGRWSIVEVVNHLADEETDDFRRRLDLTLHESGAKWPPIDPEGWCVERRYAERPLADSIERFRAERAKSLEWLRGLAEADLDRAHEHPSLGTLRSGDLLASWVAHDLLHLRQLTGLFFDSLAAQAAPYSTAYAGTW